MSHDRKAISRKYRGAHKLSRNDVAFIRASDLSTNSIASRLNITADHVRKIRRGDRAASVPAWVKLSRSDQAKRESFNELVKIGSRLLGEAQCAVMEEKWFAKLDGRRSRAPILKPPVWNELLEARPWVMAYRVSRNARN